MTGARIIEVSDLATMLADRIDALCLELLPLGNRVGTEWVEAKRKNGGLGDALRVHLVTPRRGIWSHFGDSEDAKGDALDLVAYLLFNGNKRDAIVWAKAWLGIDKADAATLDRAKRRAASDREAATKQAADQLAKMRGRAQAIWLNALPVTAGTPPWVYLAGRGCDLSRLARVPSALRYAPKLKNTEVDDDLPALVTAISGRGGMVSIHRTWLAPDRDNPRSWIKAPLDEPRKSYCAYSGGSIRLWRGASGRPLAQARPGELVCLTEGIEDGLTVAIAMPDARVLVAVSLSNMANVELPDAVTEIVLCADNEPGNKRAVKALDRAIEAHLKAGRKVRVARPAPGDKDFNDTVQRVG